MEIKLVTSKIPLSEVRKLAQESFGEMVKAVVDIEQEVMAVGGKMHYQAEELLLEQGSKQDDLWGFNIYPGENGEYKIEFESLINIRPRLNNRSMIIEDEGIRQKIRAVFAKLTNQGASNG